MATPEKLRTILRAGNQVACNSLPVDNLYRRVYNYTGGTCVAACPNYLRFFQLLARNNPTLICG